MKDYQKYYKQKAKQRTESLVFDMISMALVLIIGAIWINIGMKEAIFTALITALAIVIGVKIIKRLLR